MSKLPPPGIDAEAWSFAVQHLKSGFRGPGTVATKEELHVVGDILKNLPGPDIIGVLEAWLATTRRTSLTLTELRVMAGWLRDGYSTRQVLQGLERAAEAAQRSGQTIISPNFVTPHIHQLANSPAEKDARAGRLR